MNSEGPRADVAVSSNMITSTLKRINWLANTMTSSRTYCTSQPNLFGWQATAVASCGAFPRQGSGGGAGLDANKMGQGFGEGLVLAKGLSLCRTCLCLHALGEKNQDVVSCFIVDSARFSALTHILHIVVAGVTVRSRKQSTSSPHAPHDTQHMTPDT